MGRALPAPIREDGARTTSVRPSRLAPLREVTVSMETGQAAPAGPAFATVEIHRDLDAAAPAWLELLANALATGYQTPAFLKAWVDHVAAEEGVEPLIAIARDEQGRPVALLPFGVSRACGVRVAGFLGGTHVNYNVPVIRLDRLDSFDRTETHRLLRATARAGGVDVFALVNQPAQWQGARNPFAVLPAQPSPDPAFSGPLAADFATHFATAFSVNTRSKQRRKLRRIQDMGDARLFRATTAEERSALIDVYLRQKREQLAARGIASVFDKPGVRDFLLAATGATGGPAAVDLYGFSLNGEVLAVAGALPRGDRLSCMVNSFGGGEAAKYSPGELLLTFVVEDAIGRGFRAFDLGAGNAPYKLTYCPNVEELADTVIGVTAKGRAAAWALRSWRAVKARIKNDARAYGLIQRIRRIRNGRKSETAIAETDEG